MTTKRRPLSKKTRFEVFKRDSFSCQYCGQRAPDVVLQADHIKPVSRGGTNAIVNLITSCHACNSGKGARLLSDDSALKKQHDQGALLQERRNQLKMLEQWYTEMADMDAEEDAMCVRAFNSLAKGRHLNDSGARKIADVRSKFGTELTLRCIRIVGRQYLREKDGESVPGSIEEALQKLPGTCYNQKRRDADPTLEHRQMVVYRAAEKYSQPRHVVSPLVDSFFECHGRDSEDARQMALSIMHASNWWIHFKDAMEGVED